jgi:preprotein translocase subunit SecY
VSALDELFRRLPGIEEPKVHLSFKARLKWTAAILLLFLVMGQITLYGVATAARERFQFFEMILGSSIGSLVTLGIGPIVTASIILQLLVGSKILQWDLKTKEGKARFQGMQKLLAIFFAFFEAVAFVSFGALQPASSDAFIVGLLVMQLALGALLLLLMDEVVSKWGIGSGVSLFIAAGVAKTIFVRAFNPLSTGGENIPAGLIPQSIVLFSSGDISNALIALLPVIATLIVFAVVVYVQALRVEIPLAFGSIRGFSRRWPLKLIYTSNIPVILVAALIANLQLVGSVIAKPVDETTRCGLLGCYDNQGVPISGIVYYLQQPGTSADLQLQIFFIVFLVVIFAASFAVFYYKLGNGIRIVSIAAVIGLLLSILITNSTIGLPSAAAAMRAIVYILVFIVGATVFSMFWVSTSGMDSKSVAEQIQGIGMSVPGFRRDPRIVEQVLERYIPTLSIISGLSIGMLAAVADLTNAIGSGTGILLAVMIVYNFYEQIAARYVEDMHPALRKFFGGS